MHTQLRAHERGVHAWIRRRKLARERTNRPWHRLTTTMAVSWRRFAVLLVVVLTSWLSSSMASDNGRAITPVQIVMHALSPPPCTHETDSTVALCSNQRMLMTCAPTGLLVCSRAGGDPGISSSAVPTNRR